MLMAIEEKPSSLRAFAASKPGEAGSIELEKAGYPIEWRKLVE
jgi:hypothetical protein